MKLSNIKKSAILVTIILAGLGIFQILLIIGLPLGHSAWGGMYRVLPWKLRIGSFVSIIIYIVAIYTVWMRSGLINMPSKARLARIGTWIFFVLFLFSALMNFASKSQWERYIMAPLACMLTSLFLLIARTKPNHQIK